jgi:phosphonoacetaldehyde hydrolase
MQLKAIIFDWAGTTVDFGSLCPINAFQAAFAGRGVSVKAETVHRFMGMKKRDHIEALLALPEVAAAWHIEHKHDPVSKDVDAIYQRAEQLIVEIVPQFATPTPYLIESVEMVRSRGLKIGSTTGYTSAMMERLVPTARRKGYAPDTWVASDQVPQGRPWPWMIFKNMEELGVCPPCTVVKVGDTITDITEGINAGVWSVGVVESSSLIGKSPDELAALPGRTRNLAFRRARKSYAEAGAHFVISNLSELENILEQIESRLDRGMMPPRVKRRTSVLSVNFLL